MKWGRKRHTSGSSEPRSSSLISHVFPSSWFSKFKQKSRDTESKSVTGKRKGASSLASVGSPRCANNATVAAREGRFYGGEGDAFWRLSFGKEGFEEKNRNDNLRSVWYDSDNELEAPPSSCRNFRSNAKSLMGEADIKKFNNLILDARKMPGFRRDMEMLPDFDRIKREEKLKKTNRKERWSKFDRNPNETEEILRTSIENINMEFERWKLIDADLGKHGDSSLTNWRNYDLTTIGEDGAFAEHSSKGNYRISAEKRSTEWEKLKDMKIKEIKSKSEDQRKSVYVSRELQRRAKQNSRVKVSSPRIKALEDMKKAKMKTKRGKEKTMEGRTGLESCAVAKCSYDPQKDFRDSMIEMIMEKQIRRPEQLEELLACYLTLNSDVYHDLIIKVFRQVWFDLNQSCFDKEI